MIKKKIIYGAGAMGKRAFEYYTKDDPDCVYCFADTFKGGTTYCGKSVISFEELKEIYRDYNVVICIFDLFELLFSFDKAGIDNYSVWNDDSAEPDEELIRRYNDYLRKFDKQDSRQKILYGAGDFGKRAFYYYGSERIYAFADMNRHGSEYLSKPVLNPAELTDLNGKYDIIICAMQYSGIFSYLKSINVDDFRLLVHLEDVRADNAELNPVLKNTINDPDIIKEWEHLDYIENSELINNYYGKYMSHMRKSNLKRTEKEKKVIRFIEENKNYGYCKGMLNFAERDDFEYYEAPAVAHGYESGVMEREYLLYWYNLIEAGEFNKKYIHRNYKDALYFTVGPYFNYAPSFYNGEKLSQHKKKIGKNLTVFPIHSILNTTVDYSSNEFVDIVLKEAKNFKSLTVCTHFNDFNSETVKLFRANGAKIVTAGFAYDSSFIKRLKTIMLLSDAVITNGLGTHVGHALSVNRPVKMISQKIKTHSLFDSNEYGDIIYGETKPKLHTILETDDYHITREILDIYEPTLGFTKVKTKEEMGAIFDLSKRILQNCDYKRSGYIDSIRRTYRDLQKAVTAEEKLQFKLMKEALPSDYEEYLKGMGL